MDIPVIVIRRGKEESILRRHPWIFSGAVFSDTETISEGQVVRVMDSNNRFLCLGHFQPSTIAVRILTFEDRPVDTEFYIEKLKNAFELRKSLGLFAEHNTIFRVVHGEGDGLPGLVVDFYNGVAVIQCHSIGMYHAIDSIVEGLKAGFGEHLKAVYHKSSETLPPRIQPKDGYLFGNCAVPHVATENGIRYNIDWITGQKTGFFIDQRENRALLAKYAKGKKILNTFCYSGGFSLSAINGGALFAHSLDSSRKAIELTDANIALNKMEAQHKSIVADTMEYIKDLPEEYDIIILDPPAFAKHRDKRHKAIQGYKRLNAHAIRQIKSGGLIFTFSCSQVVDKYLFNNTVIAAAIESGREVRIIEQLHQPADHPVNAFHPEGEYLKGLVIQVI
ncbi:MAG: class I SAM-dependent rRNA methyltransferase [Flavobacteriia bacterium]|nr:class I SAM-dependent rRNA methyltransferase [Flavobacteriia bacterium]OJX34878.1 MAG: rRNA large subunit methyltransferase I [Flavobacteriia bacterium 40-80]